MHRLSLPQAHQRLRNISGPHLTKARHHLKSLLRDHFARGHANDVVVQDGYSAPYLYLLKEDEQKCTVSRKGPSEYTLKKLRQVERAMDAGAGQGRGDLYKPWIRIRRGFSRPVSHQVFEQVSVNLRNHHFLSKLEHHTALVTAYMGSVELRECLPMWPYEHPHPCADLNMPLHVAVPKAPGLIDMARELGIDHGVFVGTKVPYIASIDLMHAIPREKGSLYLGISCKPKEIIDKSARARERLRLDEHYCVFNGIHHVVEDGTGLNAQLVGNLTWLRPLTSEVREHRGAAYLQDYAGWLDEAADHLPLHLASLEAGRKCRVDQSISDLYFRLSVWLHLVDIDLSKPVQMRRPLRRGGEKVLAALRAHYLGGEHV